MKACFYLSEFGYCTLQGKKCLTNPPSNCHVYINADPVLFIREFKQITVKLIDKGEIDKIPCEFRELFLKYLVEKEYVTETKVVNKNGK